MSHASKLNSYDEQFTEIGAQLFQFFFFMQMLIVRNHIDLPLAGLEFEILFLFIIKYVLVEGYVSILSSVNG